MLAGEHASLEGLPSVLDRMAGPEVPTLAEAASNLRQGLRRGSPTGGPLQPALLALVLGYLFPDSGPSPHPYPETLELPAYAVACYGAQTPKTAPPDSLVWRLATAAACCLQVPLLSNTDIL